MRRSMIRSLRSSGSGWIRRKRPAGGWPCALPSRHRTGLRLRGTGRVRRRCARSVRSCCRAASGPRTADRGPYSAGCTAPTGRQGRTMRRRRPVCSSTAQHCLRACGLGFRAPARRDVGVGSDKAAARLRRTAHFHGHAVRPQQLELMRHRMAWPHARSRVTV